MFLLLETIFSSDRAGEGGAGAERCLHGERGSPEHIIIIIIMIKVTSNISPEHPSEEPPGPRLLAAHTEVGGPRRVALAAVLLVDT